MTSEQLNPNGHECSPALWEAVRYLSGELSTEQMTSFEDRLADDLDLSEALATAVRLTTAVSAAESTQTVPSLFTLSADVSGTRTRKRRVVAVAACAALFALLAWSSRPRVSSPASPQGTDGVAKADGTEGPADSNLKDRDLDSVLSAWVELNQSREVLVDDPALETLLVDASADVPDWMFAALQTDAGLGGAEMLPIEVDGQPEGSL